MTSLSFLAVVLTSITPWLELRGAIPMGIAMCLDPFKVFAFAVIFNIIVFFPVWLVLHLIYKRIKNWRITQRIENHVLRNKPIIDRWGVIGLAIFVAIPLPFTGAYTATILAWMLRMSWKKSFLAISLGVIAAGLIMWILTIGIASGIGYNCMVE